MKYLIAEWGLEAFKAKVEEYYGETLPEPHAAEILDVDDHVGWHEQGDGKLFLGVNVEQGRIKDAGHLRIKSGLRAIVEKFGPHVHLTALQAVILSDIAPSDRAAVDALLVEHGIKPAEELTATRRFSIACPALPTCGLAVTESERVMPGVVDQLEAELARLGLAGERIAVHMTGCPNGCARTYTSDIGLVGKAVGKYTLYLGGDATGTRLSFLYADMVPLDEIVPRLSPLLEAFRTGRQERESFGDFCARLGKDELAALES
jgi:sulfite reductase (ferredoxin)